MIDGAVISANGGLRPWPISRLRPLPARPLREFVAGVARGMGADPDVAAELARHLVGSNLAGHDSHGVIRVPQYVGDADQGPIVPSARPVLARETPVAALVDARRGFGQHSTMFALEWAMGQARQHGVAMVAVRHSTHIGRLGEYVERTAAEGLIGIVTVGAIGVGNRRRRAVRGPDAVPRDQPVGAVRAGPHAEPASSMPRRRRSPRARSGSRGPPGSRCPPTPSSTRTADPTRDAAAFYAGGAILPLGGTLAGHKGYGLGLASALLGALGMIGDPRAHPRRRGAARGRRHAGPRRGRLPPGDRPGVLRRCGRLSGAGRRGARCRQAGAAGRRGCRGARSRRARGARPGPAEPGRRPAARGDVGRAREGRGPVRRAAPAVAAGRLTGRGRDRPPYEAARGPVPDGLLTA